MGAGKFQIHPIQPPQLRQERSPIDLPIARQKVQILFPAEIIVEMRIEQAIPEKLQKRIVRCIAIMMTAIVAKAVERVGALQHRRQIIGMLAVFIAKVNLAGFGIGLQLPKGAQPLRSLYVRLRDLSPI